MTWWFQFVSSALGALCAGFLVWAVRELYRRRLVRIAREQEDVWAEQVARSYGVEREPGESIQRLQSRVRAEANGQARYPRLPR